MSKTDGLRAMREAATRLREGGRTEISAPTKPDQTVGYINAIRAQRGAAPVVNEDGPPPPKGRKGKMVEGVVLREGTPDQRLDIRLKVGERAKLVRAADQSGKPLSVWARAVLLKEAGIWTRS